MQFSEPGFAELAVRAGYDFVAVDMEHTGADDGTLPSIFSAMNGSDCLPAARVSANSLMYIRKPLDLGAKVLFVPLVNTAEEAKRAVESANYPPKGVRGYAFCRANNWGADFDQYVQSFNDELLLIVMVESAEAVQNIDEILAVDGVDGVLLGPYDLSGSYGVSGKLDDVRVTDAIELVGKACNAAGKIAGQHIVTPTKALVENAVSQGYNFLALGMDVCFAWEGLQNTIRMAGRD